MTDKVDDTTAGGRWHLFNAKRGEVLRRAEQAALKTIPALFVREGHNENTSLPTPYQAFGAKALNLLASKLLLALFPPNSRFFKLTLDDAVKEALKGRGVEVEEVDKQLGAMEMRVVTKIEASNLRSTISNAAKQLIACGNYLIGVDSEMNIRGFGLRSYVVNRDPEGNVLELIIREEVAPETLTPEVLEACECKPDEKKPSSEKTLQLFTRMWREKGKYLVKQELCGKTVPGSEGSYPLDSPGFIVLRWTAIHGEDYGRGMVSEYQGDFNALDDLSRDLLKASGNAAKVVFVTAPNSQITPAKLAKASNGTVLVGKADDVGTIGLDKYGDFRFSTERLNAIRGELAEAFLMNSAVQRNAERVTAEEIRFVAQELEDALGGVYSLLANELQRPLVNRMLKVMQKANELPALPKKQISLTITTGLDALGRGHELNKLVQFADTSRRILGEEETRMRLKPSTVLTKIGNAMGLDSTELVQKDDEVKAAQQQQSLRQLAEKAIPGVAQEAMKQGATQ